MKPLPTLLYISVLLCGMVAGCYPEPKYIYQHSWNKDGYATCEMWRNGEMVACCPGYYPSDIDASGEVMTCFNPEESVFTVGGTFPIIEADLHAEQVDAPLELGEILLTTLNEKWELSCEYGHLTYRQSKDNLILECKEKGSK